MVTNGVVPVADGEDVQPVDVQVRGVVQAVAQLGTWRRSRARNATSGRARSRCSRASSPVAAATSTVRRAASSSTCSTRRCCAASRRLNRWVLRRPRWTPVEGAELPGQPPPADDHTGRTQGTQLQRPPARDRLHGHEPMPERSAPSCMGSAPFRSARPCQATRCWLPPQGRILRSTAAFRRLLLVVGRDKSPASRLWSAQTEASVGRGLVMPSCSPRPCWCCRVLAGVVAVVSVGPAAAADPAQAATFRRRGGLGPVLRRDHLVGVHGRLHGLDEPDGTKTFRPGQPVARDAMAAFRYRFAGSPDVSLPAVSPFADVTTQTQFYKEICWLAAQGVSTGWDEPDGTKTFRPLQSVNRDAMAAFMYRFAGKPGHTVPATSPFADVAPASQFFSEITWLAAARRSPPAGPRRTAAARSVLSSRSTATPWLPSCSACTRPQPDIPDTGLVALAALKPTPAPTSRRSANRRPLDRLPVGRVEPGARRHERNFSQQLLVGPGTRAARPASRCH